MEVVDIGGGVGQLARVLSLYHKIPVTTIDRDPHLQHLGRKRLAKYPKPEGHARLEFVETSFESQKLKSSPDLLKKFTPNTVILGLHTCGPLAIEHAVVGLESPGMGFLNFACCYNKLDCERDTNLSAHAKKAGLVLNNYALTLATRGHADMTLQEYRFKRRVKSYRYVLQLLAGEWGLNSNLKSVGSALPGTYNGEFSDYALEKLSFANVEHSLSKKNLDDFYKRDDIQNAFNTMFLANLIRWQLGRVIELHLLLDRALWIEEKGHRVSLKQYFDENLSPRNIGLLVLKET